MKLLTVTCLLLATASFAQNTGEHVLNQLPPEKIEVVKEKVSEPPLTNSQVQEAVISGAADKNKAGDDIGLKLEDSGQKFSNAMVSMNTPQNASSNHSGFAVRLFTPLAWVAYTAHEAKRKYMSYAAADASESDRLPVLRVVVKPDTPDYVAAGAGMNASSSVEHVVLRSSDKKDVVQPLTTLPYEVESKNGMGGSKSYNGVIAIFSMADLEKLRKTSEKKEFLVTVIGESGKERDFKVKEKHFQRLQ